MPRPGESPTSKDLSIEPSKTKTTLPGIPYTDPECSRPPPSPILDPYRPYHVYCGYYLRNAVCSYKSKCKYSHEIPTDKVRRQMGIFNIHPALTGKAAPGGDLPTRKAEIKQLASPRSQAGPQAVSKREPEHDKPKPAPLQQVLTPSGMPEQLASPRSQAGPQPDSKREPEHEQPKSASLQQVITPSRTPSSPPITLSQTGEGCSSSPSVPKKEEVETSGTYTPTSKVGKTAAFEEEQYLEQKRHEIMMKLLDDKHKLELEHELKMAELRKKYVS